MITPTSAHNKSAFKTFEECYSHLTQTLDEESQQQVRQALEYAWTVYDDKSNPYLPYSIDVACILQELQVDSTTLSATLLTDYRLRESLSVEKIDKEFGESIAKLAAGVIKLNTFTEYEKIAAEPSTQMETLRRMLLIMSEDMRGIVIKLAYRLQRLRLIKQADNKLQHLISKETLDVFSPIANRLGLGQIKWELEDLSFRYLYPEEYKHIATLLDEKRTEREDYIANAVMRLQKVLVKENITCHITGRPKHIYSIWRKMRKKNLDFHQLYDLQAVRIIVPDNDIANCYRILGIVHNVWLPITEEFSDYIGKPKPNGYRSLHTIVIGDKNKILEIQIRTSEMHEQAEFGVAAHWSYKEGIYNHYSLQENINRLRELLEGLLNSDEGIEQNLSAALVSDYIYVLTPKGKLIELPKGATPIDFAYELHTEIGHGCRGAKVNGKIVQLNRPLKTGETVEILTHKHGQPSRDWLILNYVKTNRARNRIRQWFNQQENQQLEKRGKTFLEDLLGSLSPSIYETLQQHFSYKRREDLLIAIGQGQINRTQIQKALYPEADKNEKDTAKEDHPTVTSPPPLPSGRSTDDVVYVEGVDNLLTQFAPCCHPIPGDNIVGYITQFRGITIHKEDCPNLKNLAHDKPERIINVSWNAPPVPEVYPVAIRMMAFDRKGLLKDISQVFYNADINIISSQTHTNQHKNAVFEITAEFESTEKLENVMAKLEKLQNIWEVIRIA